MGGRIDASRPRYQGGCITDGRIDEITGRIPAGNVFGKEPGMLAVVKLRSINGLNGRD
jgi:hypothetical protein